MKLKNLKDFPKDFLWGASTSAYQVEGGTNEGGKGKNVMDLTDFGPEICDFSVASDFYHKYKEDIAMFKEMGMKSFRFSFSWARIFPDASGKVNQEGVDYYKDMINELNKHGIEPVATIYHFDMPVWLQEKGGWSNKEVVIKAYVDFAKVLLENYNDQVKYWLTINEQNMMVLGSTATDFFGAGSGLTGNAKTKDAFTQSHHMFLGQAIVSKIINTEYPHCKVGAAPNIVATYPASNKPEDYEAAIGAGVMRNWFFLDAIVRGEYNPLAYNYLKEYGWLPEITEEDKEILKDQHQDFIAFNYYSSMTVESWTEETDETGMMGVFNQQMGFRFPHIARGVPNENLQRTEYGWEIDPIGFKTTLTEMYERYRLPLMITENGMGVREELNEDMTVNDDYRIEYYTAHLTEMKKAISEGVEVFSYNPWTAIDLVSTHEGISKRYGFIFVNRHEHDLRDLKRYPKKSFYWYQELIKTNGSKLK
ncbi:glycoside hydrolase family 1 protein [[Acholeplasma] multilocale]|uniref:glycoside hydrolase family 1 protein n=1 Tax=[Acholeplasma] multilocale TaxID=264638 RepID=UPI00047A0085|nr:glycoside hydrolase family 1 protein [[Acholeplasma] multilocale]